MRAKYFFFILLFLFSFSLQGQVINPSPYRSPNSTINPKSMITVDPNKQILTVDPKTPIWTPIDPNKVLIDTGVGNVALGLHTFPEKISYAYIPNRGAGTVSVLNLANHTKVTDIQVGIEPNGVAITPDGKFVFVTNYYSEYSNYNSSYGPSLLSVIDTATNTKIKDIYVGAGARGIAMVETPYELKAYVANYLSNTVSVIDVKTLTPIKQVPVGNKPFGVALGRQELPPYTMARVYVVNSNENTPYTSSITVLNAAESEKEIKTIQVGNLTNAKSVVFNPYQDHIYVTESTDDGHGGFFPFGVINNQYIDTGTQGIGFNEGLFPSSIAVAHDGSKIYIGYEKNSLIGKISNFDYSFSRSDKEVLNDVSNQPRGIALSNDDKKLYIVNHGNNTVSVVNTVDNSLIKEIPVGIGPEAIGNFVGPTLQPEVKFSVPNLNFSSTKKGEISASQEVILSNKYVPIKIVRIEVPANFNQTNNCTILKSGDSCKINVSFQPTEDNTPGGEMKVVDEWGRAYPLYLRGLDSDNGGIIIRHRP